MRFVNSIVQPASRQSDDTPALRICVHAMMRIAYRMANFSDSHVRAFDIEERAEEHLSAALQDQHHLLLFQPSLLAVQALICVVMSMRLSAAYTAQQAGIVLANACRSAHYLGIDGRADEMHLVEYCVFCALHILDAEMSMQTLTAPLMQDENDSFNEQILLIADLGSVSNTQDDFNLGVFVARIKLAVIQKRMWTDLISAKSKTQIREDRSAALDDIRALLVRWTRTYLPPEDMLHDDSWPATIYVHVVRLVLSYFSTIRVLFPATLSSAAALGERLTLLPEDDDESIALIREDVILPVELAAASTLAFTAVRSIGVGLLWLDEILPSMVSAAIVMYQSIILQVDADNARDWLGRAEICLETLRQSQAPAKDDLASSMRVLLRLKALAARAIACSVER